jgi:hypothetical protein
MTHKPAVGIGGFGRDNTSKLIDRSRYIASAALSSSPSSKAPQPMPRLAAEQTASAFEGNGGERIKRILKQEVTQQTDRPAMQ